MAAEGHASEGFEVSGGAYGAAGALGRPKAVGIVGPG